MCFVHKSDNDNSRGKIFNRHFQENLALSPVLERRERLQIRHHFGFQSKPSHGQGAAGRGQIYSQDHQQSPASWLGVPLVILTWLFMQCRWEVTLMPVASEKTYRSFSLAWLALSRSFPLDSWPFDTGDLVHSRAVECTPLIMWLFVPFEYTPLA